MEVVAENIPKDESENVTSENSKIAVTTSPPLMEPPKKSKKEDKSVEQFLKSLNSISNVDEKIAMVSKKYVQSSEDNKKLLYYIKQSDKRYGVLLKEKEHLQHEFNKTILVKSKLENLCRELQKQNKAIKEESLLKIREEEERRKETQAKFQNTLSEITTLLQQNNEKNIKLRDDNISMSEKFKSVVQQYQLREQQVEKMAKQMALESQLSDAKIQKANLEHQAEKERLLAEMEQMKVTVAQYNAKVVELQSNETCLKGQLVVYTDKYDEFQNALVKSNQVFGSFKEQMEMMSKKIKKLEKESLSWKKKWETSQTALLDMCAERHAGEERVAATTRQLQHMQSLCRTLQAERTLLLNSLKENNIERPPLPAPSPAPPPPAAPAQPPAGDAKVEEMVANCAQLRQSLAHLQTQLNVLTNIKNGAPEEPAKPDKQKKSKSKKNKGDKQTQKTDSDKSDVKEESDEPNNPEKTSKVKQQCTNNSAIKEESECNEIVTKNKVDDCSDNKIDEKTVENLVEAINMANINLCDLEAANKEVFTKIDVVEELKQEDSVKLSQENIAEKQVSNTPIEITEKLSQVTENSSSDGVSHVDEVKPITEVIP